MVICSVGSLGSMMLVSFESTRVFSLVRGVVLSSNFDSSVWMCLVVIWVSSLVMVVIVVKIFGVMVILRVVTNWAVCSICRGLSAKDFFGVFGVWSILWVRLARLLNGLVNCVLLVIEMVIAFIVKSCCLRLLISDLL